MNPHLQLKPLVHYADPTGTKPACGLLKFESLTNDHSSVTCGGCRRQTRFRATKPRKTYPVLNKL